jgi:hypothetical protein
MFSALFKNFSEADPEPDSTLVIMTPKNALDYYRLCSNNLRNVSEKDSCLEKFMVELDRDGDGKITESDFMSFYQELSNESPQLVYQHIKGHSYSVDLKPAYGRIPSYSTDPRLTNEVSMLPRASIANNKH